MAKVLGKTVGEKDAVRPAAGKETARKTPRKATKKAVKKAAAKSRPQRAAKTRSGAKEKQDDVSRKEVFYEALDRVRKALGTEEKPSTSTIGNLVQLLKLHKDIAAEEELPHEIRVLWQETHDDPSNDV